MKAVWVVQRFGRLGPRRKFLRILSSIVLTGAATVFLLYFLLGYCLANDPRLVPVAFQRARSILLVTAHPDDETLFFSPSITYHREDVRVQRSLLVISSGNYEGIGDQRRQEIRNSCAVLRIEAERCVVLDVPELQDNPKKWWDENLVRDFVAAHVAKWNVDLILTFDNGGVSGHVNHRAVSAGVLKYIQNTPTAPSAYALQSTFLLRKYSSLVDLIPTAIPFSWRILKAILTGPGVNSIDTGSVHDTSPLDIYNDKALLVSPFHTYLTSRAAFSQHESQYSWDRSLYLVMSRYMWFNTLVRLG